MRHPYTDQVLKAEEEKEAYQARIDLLKADRKSIAEGRRVLRQTIGREY